MAEGLTHHQKVDILIADLRQHGVSEWTTAPPVWRLLWRAGVRVAPPHFVRPAALALATGTLFRVLWGLLMWHLQWRGWGVVPWLAGAAAFAAGGAFGAVLAVHYRRQAARLRLPAWADYPGVAPVAEPGAAADPAS